MPVARWMPNLEEPAGDDAFTRRPVVASFAIMDENWNPAAGADSTVK